MTASMTRNRLCDVVSSKRGHASVLLTLMLVHPQGLGLNVLYPIFLFLREHVHVHVYMYQTTARVHFDLMFLCFVLVIVHHCALSSLARCEMPAIVNWARPSVR